MEAQRLSAAGLSSDRENLNKPEIPTGGAPHTGPYMRRFLFYRAEKATHAVSLRSCSPLRRKGGLFRASEISGYSGFVRGFSLCSLVVRFPFRASEISGSSRLYRYSRSIRDTLGCRRARRAAASSLRTSFSGVPVAVEISAVVWLSQYRRRISSLWPSGSPFTAL